MNFIEPSTQVKPFLVIYQSRSKAVRSIILSLMFLVTSVWMLLIPIDERDLLGHTAHILGAYGGPPLFTLTLIWSVAQLFVKKPLLVFDDAGITTRRYGLIPWSAISAVGLRETIGRPFFAIIARDIEALSSHYSAAKAKELFFNQKNMGMATGIAEVSLPMKVEQLLASVSSYCEEKIREHS